MSDETISLVHENVTFEDQVVHLNGHVYFDCTFQQCTLVFRGFPCTMSGCHFDNCVWHIDFIAHDHNQWSEFVETLVPSIEQTLPRTLAEEKRRQVERPD